MKRPFHNDASQADRRAITENDRRVRKGSTYHEFASSEAGAIGGRFAARERSTVVGATPAPLYPTMPGGAWPNQTAAVPPEPGLGFSVNELEPLGTAVLATTTTNRTN